MRFRNMSLAVIALFMLGWFAFSMVGDDPCLDPEAQAVIVAAQQGLGGLVEAIPPSDLSLFGFKTLEEATQATFGQPLRIHKITPANMNIYPNVKNAADLVTPTDEWFIPLLVKGDYRLLMKVSLIDGAWKAVGLTGRRIAGEIGEFYSRWPAESIAAGLPENTKVTFVQIVQAHADLLLVQGAGRVYFYPFSTARLAMRSEEKGLLIPELVLPQLKMVVVMNTR